MRIIYVDVDTLRADHTQPYGYQRPLTPNLQALADKGVVFERYYCSDAPCLPSRTALTSGQFGITNGVIGHFGEAARFRLDAGHAPHPDRPLLGQRLGQHGIYTAAVSMFAERHRAYYFLGNFRESIRATDEINDEDGRDINRVGLDWIRRHAREDNWYLHLTYWEPHTPYLTEPGWTDKAGASGPPPAWPDQAAIDAHADVYGPRSALDLQVLGQGAHTYQRAVRTRDHMYIRTYHPGCMKVDWEQLYDVTADPHLTTDLIEKEPTLAGQMRTHLSEWWHTHAGRPGALPDPMQATLQTGPVYYNDPGRYLGHLRNTGRGHLAEDLKERLATATGATPVSWHAPEIPWTPERHEWLEQLIKSDEFD